MEIDHVISTSVNATVVSWSPPLEPNGVITGYEVVYSLYGLDAESVIGPLGSDLYTINITGLSEYYVHSSLCITYICHACVAVCKPIMCILRVPILSHFVSA